MKVILKAGSTSNILQVFIQDSSSTTGAGLTGLVFNSGSLTAYYHKDSDSTATAISLVTMTVGTFTSSGFKEIDATNMPGWYQLCIPNAVVSSGNSAAVHLKGATNMAPLPIEIQLSAVDLQDATAFGLSRIDAAISSRSTYSGGAVASVTAAVTVGTNSDKTGYTLSTTGQTNLLDQTLSGHTTAGTVGGALNTAGSAGDPWATLIPGAYGAGTAGNIVGTNVNATVSSRSTYAGGAVASVTGNVGGNVVGSVASVTAGVTVTTNNDKTGYALVSTEYNNIADALLKRDWTSVSGEAAKSVLNALRFLRNKWAISGTTITVYKEDGTTSAWTGTVASSAGAAPVISVTP